MVIYNLAVRAYWLAIRTAALRDAKAAQWISGRKDWEGRLLAQVQDWGPRPRIWVHCASYGEFEQGRPVMEALRQKYPAHKILLTFFSPSGYMAFKDWEGVDAVTYLPLDTGKNADTFIHIINPAVILFIKYEFWVNFLNAIRSRKIPCYLVSAVFKAHHPFFKWYGHIFRRSLRTFTRIFIQDEPSGFLLKNIDIHNFEVCGDTRFDRVLQIKDNRTALPGIEKFKGNAPLIIAGSTWPEDEKMVIAAFKRLQDKGAKLLIAPHNIDERSLQATKEKLENSGLSYSVYTQDINSAHRVLLLDTMGMLSGSYYYGDCAYIGGGFDGGLHNSLEAAVFNLPVTFFGNDYTRFNEAVELLRLGAAENVKNDKALAAAWQRFLDGSKKSNVADVLSHYFEKNRNSTARILAYLDF